MSSGDNEVIRSTIEEQYIPHLSYRHLAAYRAVRMVETEIGPWLTRVTSTEGGRRQDGRRQEGRR